MNTLLPRPAHPRPARPAAALASAVLVAVGLVAVPAARAQQDVVAGDRAALVALYNATGGTTWTCPQGPAQGKRRWLQGLVREWTGVTVEGTRVVGLRAAKGDCDLGSLAGPLPAALGALTALRSLELDGTAASGTLPKEIGRLVQLGTLSLRANRLTGALTDSLRHLRALTSLDLSGNGLTGPLPDGLGALARLRVLQLDGNDFSGAVPASFTGLDSLFILHLRGRGGRGGGLTSLPDVFGSYTDVSDVDVAVDGNRLQFDALEPLGTKVDLASGRVLKFARLLYTPQDSLGAALDTAVRVGAAVARRVPVAGRYNRYQWFKDGQPMTGATADALQIAAATPADAGTYLLRVTNNAAPALTLWSRPLRLAVGGFALVPTGPTAFGTVRAGAPLQQTFTLSNDGTVPIQGVVSLSGGGGFTLASGGGAYTLQAGGSREVVVRFDPTRAGPASAVLSVTHNQARLPSPVQRVLTAFGYPSVVDPDVRIPFEAPTLRSDDYRLVGLPGVVDLLVSEVIEGTPERDWGAYRDDGDGDEGTALHRFEDADAFRFRPGRGFWVLGLRRDLVYDVPTPTVALDAAQGFTIPVHPGWNIISNPFDIDVRWDDVTGAGADDEGGTGLLWRWTGDGYGTDAVFRSAAGTGLAYYYENTAGFDSLRIPYVPFDDEDEDDGSDEVVSPADAPVLRLTVAAGTRTARADVRLRADAAAGLDRHDAAAPPGWFEKVSLRLVRETDTGRTRELAREYRPAKGPDGDRFDLVVRATEGAATLTVDGVGAYGPGTTAVLVDAETGDVRPVADGVPVPVRATREGRRHVLLVGTAAFVAGARAALVPDELTLVGGRPNPFRDRTTLRYGLPAAARVRLALYDVLGREVAVLASGEARAGLHEAVLDGAPLAAGVYVVRLTVDGATRTAQVVRAR